MKKKIIAVSAEEPLFRQNRLLVKSWAKKYPGASWLPLLKQYLCDEFKVVTADVAFDHVKYGFWHAENIMVIQHGQDHITQKLIEQGAIPLVLTCFESPLYIGGFYQNVLKIAPKFKSKILFNGLFHGATSELSSKYQVTFPSYFLEELNKTVIPWIDKKFIVTVVGNKYVIPECCPSLSSPLEWMWFLRKKISQKLRGSSVISFPVKNIQLQDFRLEAISFFLSKGLLDLYGKGWGSLRNIPPYWQNKLKPLLKSNSAKCCDDKLDTIRNYKYCLCIENAAFPGYVTEKIIDCLVAGVIPIYMGAPDIENLIPKSCFINFRDFREMEELLLHLNLMNVSDANKMIESGKSFLRSDLGHSYSYEGFANFIADLVKEYNK